jgi:lipopolysaccharide/colanic/teichoic acid biosynthesis glycosyltransferase
VWSLELSSGRGLRGPTAPRAGDPARAPAVNGYAPPRRDLSRCPRQDLRARPTRPAAQLVAARPTTLEKGAARANASALKRLIDIAGAGFGLLLLAPVLLFVAALIRIESRGPALFRQRRTGRHGQVFQIYKFRTMQVQEDGPVVVQAAAADNRVTRVGAFLRRSCIDELPQLFNVLRGEMTLVGPRPHALAHDAYYAALIPEYGERFLVRPGIAGLAQVSGYRGATETVELMAGRICLDREYIERWNLKSDLEILIRAVTEGPFHPAAF